MAVVEAPCRDVHIVLGPRWAGERSWHQVPLPGGRCMPWEVVGRQVKSAPSLTACGTVGVVVAWSRSEELVGRPEKCAHWALVAAALPHILVPAGRLGKWAPEEAASIRIWALAGRQGR